MKTRFSAIASALAAIMASSPASAIQFDGFFTVGAATHDDKNKNRYIGSLGDRGITDDITFETDTRFGLQMSSDVAEDTSVVAQILATGVDSNFNAVVEWAYVDYEINNYISLRAGKIKQPVYLVNDYVEVGFAYPWIRPPVEVYYLNNPLNTVNGAELLLAFPIGKGQLTFQPYIGSNRDDIPNTGGVAFFEAEGIAGIDVKYAAPGYLVHASTFHCREVTTQGNLIDQPTAFGFSVDVDLNGTGKCDVTSAGLNLDLSNFVVYAEWQERTTSDTLARPFGDTEAWYTTFGYRFGKWLPHITFASIEGKAATINPGAVSCAASSGGCTTPLGPVPAGTPLFNFPVPIQTSVTAGLRYEVNDSAALKIEYSVVDVENDPAEVATSNNPFGINFGLFDTSFTGASPNEKVGITSVALDVIF
jgi:hypothetical protein